MIVVDAYEALSTTLYVTHHGMGNFVKDPIFQEGAFVKVSELRRQDRNFMYDEDVIKLGREPNQTSFYPFRDLKVTNKDMCAPFETIYLGLP